MSSDRSAFRGGGLSLVLAAALVFAAACPAPAHPATLCKDGVQAQGACGVRACGPGAGELRLGPAGAALREAVLRLVAAVPIGGGISLERDPARAFSSGLPGAHRDRPEPHTVLEVVPEPSARDMMASGCPPDLRFTFLYCAPDECTLFMSWPAYCAFALPSHGRSEPAASRVLLELAAFDGRLEGRRYLSPLLLRAAESRREPRRIGRGEGDSRPAGVERVSRAPAAARRRAGSEHVAARAGVWVPGPGWLKDPLFPQSGTGFRRAVRRGAKRVVPVAPSEPW